MEIPTHVPYYNATARDKNIELSAVQETLKIASQFTRLSCDLRETWS